MATQAGPTIQSHASEQLPRAEIVYQGQAGSEYTFSVSCEGATRHPVYDDSNATWRCDCDGFDAGLGACLHTELVVAWRRSRKERAEMETAPSSPQTNGSGAPPAPKSIPKEAANGSSPPKHRRGKQSAAPASAFPTPATGVSAWSQELAEALLAPFPAEMVGWKAQATTRDGSRAMAVAYVDARCVQDRLDEVVGPENWSDAYTVLDSSANAVVVACRLTVLGITKEDVGTGEDAKAAYSDAFKRAAVKFGVSRFLYSLPKRWVDYNPQKKQLQETPQLPSWALPSR